MPSARENRVKIEYAPVMELVDMRDLGSRAAMRVGSSPFRRTRKELAFDLNQKQVPFHFHSNLIIKKAKP